MVKRPKWSLIKFKFSQTKFKMPPTKQEFVPDGHISVTSTEVHDDNKDIETPPLTRQLKHFLTQNRYEWQDKLYELCQSIDDRFINVIQDTHGNNGKSVFVEWLAYERMGFQIPPMGDIMQCCMSIKPQKCYFVDMPTGMKKNKRSEFYSKLLSLKDGVLYDKRYSFKKMRINRPQIFLFTKDYPFDVPTPEKWLIWEMTHDRKLSSPYSCTDL
jgi:hypothetical protein